MKDHPKICGSKRRKEEKQTTGTNEKQRSKGGKTVERGGGRGERLKGTLDVRLENIQVKKKQPKE